MDPASSLVLQNWKKTCGNSVDNWLMRSADGRTGPGVFSTGLSVSCQALCDRRICRALGARRSALYSGIRESR